MGHYDDLYEFYKNRPCPPYETGIIDREQYLVRKKIKKKPQTNKEWLHTLPMEEMADEIISHIAHEIGLARYYNDDDVKEFVLWLKEKHNENY